MISSNLNATTGLRMVHLLYRHGDRTPYEFYPADPYKDLSEWHVGVAQLTNRGKRMSFELGKWIKRKYEGFLSKDYSEDEIYVRSSDEDRTLMSAQVVLAGLYPPGLDRRWNEDLDWQPISVHTVPLEYDHLLATRQNCPRITQLESDLSESSYMKDVVYKANKDLFEYISDHTGLNITSVDKLASVYDTLLVETIHNKTLPEWTLSVFPGGKFDQLQKLSFIHDTFNDELKKLKAGTFINELVAHYSNFDLNTVNQMHTKKMFMYSAHDISIVRVLNTLGVYEGNVPPYSSTVMFELIDQDGLKVAISYRNETSREPYDLIIPGCEKLCPLELFKELTKAVRPGDWQNECKQI